MKAATFRDGLPILMWPRSYGAVFHRGISRGVTIFLSGLSGAGKSTIANVLLIKFFEVGGRPVTLLDGDLVRKHLSSELGSSSNTEILIFAGSATFLPRVRKIMGSLFVLQLHRMTSREKRYAR